MISHRVAVLFMTLFLASCGDDMSYYPLASKVKILEEKYPAYKKYNSFIALDLKSSLEKAKRLDANPIKGKLYGMTFAVKDNISALPWPTTAGSLLFADNLPEKNSSVVQALIDNDGLIIGKANMHELAFGITSINSHYGTVHNAIDYDYIAGGSSGGSAVAVALGLVSASLGSDTGGSGRIPAAFNGIFGFRPTTGRYPNDGMVLLSTTRDTISLMATSVAEITHIDSVITGHNQDIEWLEDIEIKNIRIGIPREYFYENLDPAVEANVKSAIAKLKQRGAIIVEESIKKIGELNQQLSFPIVLYESSQLFKPYAKDPTAMLDKIKSPDVRQTFKDAIIPSIISESDYQTAINDLRPRLQGDYQRYFKQNNLDVLLVPTTPLPAIPIDEVTDDTFSTMIRNVDPTSNAGLPAITIPYGASAVGPIGLGLELVAPANQDVRLLVVAELIHRLLENTAIEE